MRGEYFLCAMGASLLGASATALGTPMVDGALINTRVFNDDGDSVLTTTNNYPTLISFREEALDGDGVGGEFANLHNFRLSEDGGATEAVFNNDHGFSFFADMTITGTGDGEAGLNVSPWWSQQVDGRFNVRSTDGEIAVFGGRLPFYSFTTDQGLTYVKGETVRLGVAYMPNSLTMADPGAIQYFYESSGMQYASPVLAFDEGNPAEDPPYGLWGILNDARVGGFMQPFIDAGNTTNSMEATFENMVFIPTPGSALLAAAGLAAVMVRRRR